LTQGPIMDKIMGFGVKQFLEKTKLKSSSLSEDEILNIYFSILRDVASYLAKLTDSLLVATDIMTPIAKELGFYPQEIEDLVQVIKRERDTILKAELKQYPIKKHQRAPKKWGKYYPIYLALDYLEPKDLIKLIELNKETKKLFIKKVYRTIFSNFGANLTRTQRFNSWGNILEIKKVDLDYKSFLTEYEGENKTQALKQAEEVIHIDIVRSFKKHGDYNQEELKDILKAYAAFDKEVSYCQGMNYIMGFFYLHEHDPELSFKSFVKLMDRHMKVMFDKDFRQLKHCFFKLNRLVDIYLPDLAEHFKNEKIDASFYAPSWFITAFSSAFQFSPKSKFLEKIWDFFILDGPKAIFKVTLLILREYKEEILQLKFDLALNFINDFGKHELFTNIKYLEIKEGREPVGIAAKEYRIIEEFGQLMKDMHLSMELLNSFDDDAVVFEKLEKANQENNQR